MKEPSWWKDQVCSVARWGLRSRTRPRRSELQATYRGSRVVLYASSNVRVFNQVTRALRRAVEDARPPSDDYDLAAA